MGNNKNRQYKLGYMLTQAIANALQIITNIVYPNGRCEYDRYTNVFDKADDVIYQTSRAMNISYAT